MASTESQKAQQNLIQATNDLIRTARGGKSDEKVEKIITLLTITKKIKTIEGSSANIHISTDLLKCLRLMLVDNDKSIRVQSCRAMRYITCSLSILQTMASLNIPIFMMICLEREDNKYLWERMQSLKWIRHLVDHYPKHIPKCCIMSLIGIAQNGKDEFRRICLEILRALCITNTQIISECNGFKILIDSVLNPQLHDISNSLVLTIIYILDHPSTRKYLRPSLDIQRLLAPFVDINPYKKDALSEDEIEERDKRRDLAQRTLMTMLKSITGIFYLGGDHDADPLIGSNAILSKYRNKSCLRILVDLMRLPNTIEGIQWARTVIFNVLENALLPLSDSTKLDGQRGPNLIVNYVCLILMAFIKNGLIECLVDVGMRSDLDLAPRARTLLQRIQFLSAKYLPPSLCSRICNIQKVMNDATKFHSEQDGLLLIGNGSKVVECHCDCHKNGMPRRRIIGGNLGFNGFGSGYKSNLQITVQRNFANMMISELTEDAALDDMDQNENIQSDDADSWEMDEDQVSASTICHRLGPEFDLNSTFIRYRYMMDRDIPAMMFQDRIPYHAHRVMDEQRFGVDHFEQFSFKSQKRLILEKLKFDQNDSYTEDVILQMLKKTQVILSKDFMLWKMDSVWKVLNGPLWSLTNLQHALKTKFIKRLLGYLKPSKQFFCQLKWNITTIRHAQCACQLFRLLISSEIGCKNQYFQELIAELFECFKDQVQANLKKERPKLSHAPFGRSSMRRTLSRVYIVLIGILSESERGIDFFQKHQMRAFLFPLTRKEVTDYKMDKHRVVGPNDYLLRLIATNLDYAVSSDFQMLVSQWVASGSHYLRKCLITHLELLYRAQMPKFDEWSINVLSVILKDKEQRLALTALKVLEKINLSQHSIKSTQYLIDLINTQPTDSIIGTYGQFLFIKMLSTNQGLDFLQRTNWLDEKRKEWSESFHSRYTDMLETALVRSVSTTMGRGDKYDSKSTDDEEMANGDGSKSSGNGSSGKPEGDQHDEWLPYHLIHENRSDEEELYHEYLTQFPWSLSITVVRANGQEIEVATDCFFDYNCFYYLDAENKKPISLGPGIEGVVLEKKGWVKPMRIDKNSRIRIKLNIGHETLDDLYNRRSLTKTVSMVEAKQYATCSIINDKQCYLFLEGDGHCQLTRIFWSLKENEQSHSLVRPLPHLYGELAKTERGCRYITENEAFTNDLSGFITTVHEGYLQMVRSDDVNVGTDTNPKDPGAGDSDDHKESNLEINDDENDAIRSDQNNLELRSCLWALGMIGSSESGLKLLNTFDVVDGAQDAINIVDDICILTKQSPTLSIRGTCLYVLGLLSRTQHGMEQIMKEGFSFPADNLDLDLGVAIPSDIDSFFKLGRCDYVDAEYLKNQAISVYSPPKLCRPANMKPMDPNELLGQQGHTEETVLAHISALCNNVTQKSSAGALHRLRTKKPSVFKNPLLFRECLKLLNTYQFKLSAKRFILFQLFDEVILRETDNSMDLFDESLDDAVLPFQSIRDWRYNHKKKQIEKKERKRQEKEKRKRLKQQLGGKSVNDVVEPPTPSQKPKASPQSPDPYIKSQDSDDNAPDEVEQKNGIHDEELTLNLPQDFKAFRSRNASNPISPSHTTTPNGVHSNAQKDRMRAKTTSVQGRTTPKRAPPRPWPPVKPAEPAPVESDSDVPNTPAYTVEKLRSTVSKFEMLEKNAKRNKPRGLTIGGDEELAGSIDDLERGPNPLGNLSQPTEDFAK